VSSKASSAEWLSAYGDSSFRRQKKKCRRIAVLRCFKKTSEDVQKNLPNCVLGRRKLPDRREVEDLDVRSFA
jgi:hypothetical protein